MSETTRKILDFYRKIGNCDTLKYWRDTVPVDARKAWLRSFVTTVAIDKMLDERYNHIFNKHISEEIQKAFNIKNKGIIYIVTLANIDGKSAIFFYCVISGCSSRNLSRIYTPKVGAVFSRLRFGLL